MVYLQIAFPSLFQHVPRLHWIWICAWINIWYTQMSIQNVCSMSWSSTRERWTVLWPITPMTIRTLMLTSIVFGRSNSYHHHHLSHISWRRYMGNISCYCPQLSFLVIQQSFSRFQTRFDRTLEFGRIPITVGDYRSVHVNETCNIVPTHDRNPDVIFTSGGTSFPLSSWIGMMSNICSTDAMVMNRELSLKCLPGHILACIKWIGTHSWRQLSAAYLLPNPNAAVAGSLTPGSNLPSFMYRSGMNTSGCGYTFWSCSIALSISSTGPLGHTVASGDDVTDHEFPITKLPFGIKKPLYSSSSIDWWCPESGIVGCHRRHSFTMALM